MREPTSALDALLESETTIGHFTVHPLTIQRIAVLQILSSPFVATNSMKPPVEFDVMAACWAMTASIVELRNVNSTRIGKIKDRIYQWWKQNRRSLLKFYSDILIEFNRQMKLCSYVAPESTDELETNGIKTSNGWLAQTLYMAMQMGMDADMRRVIEEIPMCQLLLMRRQKQYNEANGVVWTLMDKEASDRIDNKLRARQNGK